MFSARAGTSRWIDQREDHGDACSETSWGWEDQEPLFPPCEMTIELPTETSQIDLEVPADAGR